MAILALTMGPHLGIILVPTVLSVGAAGTITFKAVGANGNVRWKLVSSNLPNEWDAALNVSGGQATLETDEIEVPGTFSVTVQCTDESRVPVVRTFAVRLMALPLTISGSFPEWITDFPATGALTISGGVPPYSGLTITSGALPDGVSLSIVGNQIVASGTPTADGAWEATVQASDAASSPASIALSSNVLRLWTPADLIVAPKIWLDWDSSVSITPGYGVNEWENHGSLGDAFTQTSLGIQPSELPAELNGLRVLRFDDAALINNSSSFRAMCQNIENCTIFSVFRRISSGTSYIAQAILTFGVGTGTGNTGRCCAYAGTGDGANNELGHLMRARDGDAASTNFNVSDIGTDWTIAVWAADYVGGQSDIFRDGVLLSSVPTLRAEKTANTISIRPVTIGQEPNPANSRLRGDIACLVAFDAALNVGDRQRLEGWAAWKCGLQASLPIGHPYKSYPPAVSP